MDITARAGALTSLPLFAGFDADEIATIASRCTEREHAEGRGAVAGGRPRQRVRRGRLRRALGLARRRRFRGRRARRAGRVPRRDRVAARRATIRDGQLLAAVPAAGPRREHFQELLRGDARALTYVSQLLARRVVATTRARVAARKSTSIGVVADDGTPGAGLVAQRVGRNRRLAHARPCARRLAG